MTARLLPVGAFVSLLRESLESDPLYRDLWLEGEVSDFSRSAVGHVYFRLRDDNGCLKCVLFRNLALRHHVLPALGDRVAVHGGLSIYPRSGAMQLQVDLVRPAGIGVASLEREYLRQRLEAEGLFDPLRKRTLPAWPQTIGVVTSLHGAAWQDIQTVIKRRYPLADLILSPARVQGDAASESLVEAFAALQSIESVEVVIVARGGGDNDDLAAFNDERVVRAVFASRVPVIAGIGHATDRTLVEEVADVVAPTPSAAAEVCVPSVKELSARVASLKARLRWSLTDQMSQAQAATRVGTSRLLRGSPSLTLDSNRRTLDAQGARLRNAATEHLDDRRRDVSVSRSLLGALDPASVLRRGYASIQHAEDGRSVFSMRQVACGDEVIAFLQDGSFSAIVDRAGARSETTGAVR